MVKRVVSRFLVVERSLRLVNRFLSHVDPTRAKGMVKRLEAVGMCTACRELTSSRGRCYHAIWRRRRESNYAIDLESSISAALVTMPLQIDNARRKVTLLDVKEANARLYKREVQANTGEPRLR